MFIDNTDSLFRYEVGGIKVGFNQNQISDAIDDKENSLLTLSTKDISFLAEIKKVYGDKVCLIYAYIDDTTLKSIISNIEGVTDRETKLRLETGRDIKESYLRFKDVFDHVVIYGGEDSVFNYRNLYRQFDSIIDSRTPTDEPKLHYADVFISCARSDSAIYLQIQTALNQRGVTVFDDSQLPVGTEWTSVIADAIQNAKIVIPVITNNSLASIWVREETKFALESAEKNGTLIIPVFDSNVNLDKHLSIKLRLGMLSGAVIEDDAVADASEKLAEKIHKLLTAEADLKALSKQVENYLCLKMYGQARDCQQVHLKMCDEVYSLSNGAFLDFEACLLSRIKLISILLDMQLFDEALEWTIDALNQLDDGDTYDVLVDQFAICCARLGMDVDSVRDLALKRLCIFTFFDPHYVGDDRMQRYMRSNLENLIDRFKNTVYAVDSIPKTNLNYEHSQSEEKARIARHGAMAIDLFDDIIQGSSKSLSRHDLIIGYERILDYCKYVGLNGDVADKCIDRIDKLNSFKESIVLGETSMESEALKVYLGKSLPGSGKYDVFISYKSEDEALAKKVYDYLTQSGKEVFFAKETLPQLGQSEYEEKIFEAIDNSCHMVLIGSNPDYLKTPWIKDEWSTFNNEIREGRKKGNLILLLADDVAGDKGRLPTQLRQKEIIKMSEFRNRLLSYLR